MNSRQIPKSSWDHIKNKTARLVSDLANPLLLPSLVFGIIGWELIDSLRMYSMTVSISFIFYTVIPFGIAKWLLSQKHISSLDAPEHRTRNKLFRYAIISSCTGSIILWVISDHLLLQSLALIYFINPIFGLLINLQWKVSIHVASVAIAGCLVSYYIIEVADISFFSEIILISSLLLILLSMMWARNQLRIHSVSEVVAGAVIGTGLTIVELILFL